MRKNLPGWIVVGQSRHRRRCHLPRLEHSLWPSSHHVVHLFVSDQRRFTTTAYHRIGRAHWTSPVCLRRYRTRREPVSDPITNSWTAESHGPAATYLNYSKRARARARVIVQHRWTHCFSMILVYRFAGASYDRPAPLWSCSRSTQLSISSIAKQKIPRWRRLTTAIATDYIALREAFIVNRLAIYELANSWNAIQENHIFRIAITEPAKKRQSINRSLGTDARNEHARVAHRANARVELSRTLGALQRVLIRASALRYRYTHTHTYIHVPREPVTSP